MYQESNIIHLKGAVSRGPNSPRFLSSLVSGMDNFRVERVYGCKVSSLTSVLFAAHQAARYVEWQWFSAGQASTDKHLSRCTVSLDAFMYGLGRTHVILS